MRTGLLGLTIVGLTACLCAGAARSEYAIHDEQTAAAVIEICRTLDGLPLGIELAAARMAAMSATEVRDRLTDRMRLLTGPELGPDRQSTLRHAVAWSYDLLDEDERDVLCTAAVFSSTSRATGVSGAAAAGAEYSDGREDEQPVSSSVATMSAVAVRADVGARIRGFRPVLQVASECRYGWCSRPDRASEP